MTVFLRFFFFFGGVNLRYKMRRAIYELNFAKHLVPSKEKLFPRFRVCCFFFVAFVNIGTVSR